MVAAPARCPAPGSRTAVDVMVAGSLAWALSGLPSTLWSLKLRHDPLQAARAAGTLVVAADRSPAVLLAAGALAHTVISFAWTGVLTTTLPERHTVAAGVGAGLAIAALDLGLIARRFPAVRALPTLPQVADHLAFGALVGAVLARRRCR